MNKKIRKLFSHTASLLIHIPAREGVSMELLSKLTGVHLGKLESLFPGKNELLEDLFDNHIAKHYEVLLDKLPEMTKEDPPAAVEMLINFYFDLFDEKRLLRQTLLKNLTPVSEQKIQDYEDQVILHMSRLFKGPTAKTRATIMMDSMMGAISCFHGEEDNTNKKKFKAELRDLLLKMPG